MTQNFPMKLMVASVGAATLILAGCGGSGSSSGGGTTAPAVTLSGTAATGAPFAGATVTILDKTGAAVGSGTTAVDGSYTITLSAGATGPFVLQAARDDLTLVSIAADTSSSTINITPITNLIASRLSTSGDPAKLAAELQANPSLLDPVKVNAKVDEIVALLKPLLDALGATANPLTGKFAADGTGSDRVLDSLSITITPDSATTSNIAVSVKQKTADGEQPAVVQFTSAAAPPSTLPAITASNLVPSGSAPLIADLLQRITACYALPVADRVNTPDATAAPATDIKAAACKTIFNNDDPTTFKSNGKHVGTGPKTTFSGIFKSGATGVVFDRGNYEFTRANGDLVVAYRSADSAGNVQNDSFVARLSSADNKLRLIGNQYDYDGGVKPYQQLREFVNQPAATYYSTGYDFSIANDGTFSKVIVTSPDNSQLTFVPSIGNSSLVLQRADLTKTNTSFLRIRSVYADNANTGNPALADTGLFFAATPATDAQIMTYAPQSSWKFDYYLTANSTTTPDATQYYKTRARAMTIPELKAQGLANLTQQAINDVKAGSTAAGFALTFTGPAQPDWIVPAGALEPTQLKLFGRGPVIAPATKGAAFDDSATVASSARTGAIYCTPQSPSDAHCTTANGVTSFASGSIASGLHLWARDPAGREFAHFYAFYTVTLP